MTNTVVSQFQSRATFPCKGPAACAALAYYLCVRAATYEILKDHPVPVDVSTPRVDVSNLRIGDPDSLRGAGPQ